jgi:hypothetical protein
MPFFALDSEMPPEICLKQVGPNTFKLLKGFRYRRPDGTDYQVLAHNPTDPEDTTDLASVPRWLWWFVASYGHQTLPALLHDQAVDDSTIERPEADRMFRMALGECGVFWFRRWMMWTAVSLETARVKNRLWLVAFVAHLVLFAGTAICFGLGLLPWWVPTAFGLGGFAWGIRWPLTVVGVVLIALPSAFVLAVWVVEWALNQIESLITGVPAPPPGPTMEATFFVDVTRPPHASSPPN